MSKTTPISKDRSTAFIKYECPSCGATLELDPFNPVVKCQYCGCNFLKTDDVSKKILLDALEIKKLEQKLASAIATNSWDIQYQCYKALSAGTDNETYAKFYQFWEVLLGHNDITGSFIKHYTIDELKHFIEIIDELPTTGVLMGNPLAVLGTKAAFKKVIKACEQSEYDIETVVDMDFSDGILCLKPADKQAFPVRIAVFLITGLLSLVPIFVYGAKKECFVILACMFGAAFVISVLIEIINDTFDNSLALISYKIKFPNGILSTLRPVQSMYNMTFGMQPAQHDYVEDTELSVYQDGIDLTYKRITIKDGSRRSTHEHIFIPYINMASARVLGVNGLSIKQRYTDVAYAFEIEDVSPTELQSIVAYLMARMQHYQIGHT